jgi:putative CocE/NonD family hydrolase
VIIGPWTHSNFTGSFPEREFGAAASGDALELTGLQLRWFDCWLKDVDNGVDREPPVTLFVMGIDRWRAEADWPLPLRHRSIDVIAYYAKADVALLKQIAQPWPEVNV